MWCSGITLALHARGPGFNPRHIHNFVILARIHSISFCINKFLIDSNYHLKAKNTLSLLFHKKSWLNYRIKQSIIRWVCGVVVSHSLCMREAPGSIPGESIIFLLFNFMKLNFNSIYLLVVTLLFYIYIYEYMHLVIIIE